MRFDPVKKVILFGGSLTLVGLAEWLITKNIEVLIYTSPRHAREILTENKLTLSQLLKSKRIKYTITNNINKDKSIFKVVNNKTLGIGIGEAWSFDQKIIKLFSGKLLDFMGIPLPRYRGGAHYTWMIMSGERKNGVRLQIINKDMVQGKFDSGKIVYSLDYLMSKNELLPIHFFKREVKEGLKVLKIFLEKVKQGKNFKLKSINENESLFMPRLNTILNGWINWQWTGKEIESFIRSFDNPYKGASTRILGKKIHLKDVKLLKKGIKFHPFQSGIILRITKNDGLIVATTDGELGIKKVLDTSGKDIKNKFFPGNRMLTYHKDFESALRYSVDYGTKGLLKKTDA